MKIFNARSPLQHIPTLGTYLLVAANVLVYVICCALSGGFEPNRFVIYAFGALYNGALPGHEYWRLIAATFLHFSVQHILFNMICLLSWGGLVEQRIGTGYFLLVYFVSGIFASLTSLLLHHAPFIGAGASGAIAGMIGALFALWMLQRIDIPARFFVINIGLNIVLMSGPISVDWQAHLGGFVAGMTLCAVLDPLEFVFSTVLLHRFPETVKINTLVLCAVLTIAGVSYFAIDIADPMPSAGEIALIAVLLAVTVKLVDLALGVRHGLAGLVALAALGYAALPLAVLVVRPGIYSGACAIARAGLPGVIAACPDPIWLAVAAALAALAVAIAAMWGELLRGLQDTGSLVLIFRAARRRSRSL